MAQLLALDLGDLLGVEGTVFRTRRGELSLALDDFTLLAKSLRPPPDKHHGLADVETRHRHRELDLMSSEETRAVFITRAKVITAVRRFLDDAGFVEVETPVLQPLYGGAAARPFVTHHAQLERDLYLRIATELYLKRLIVGGLERVYEIGKDFRNEGVSFKHNPEFTMLEWYEAYADYADIANRCEALVAHVAESVGYDGEIDFAPPWRRETLAGAIGARSKVDILANRETESLRAAMREQGLDVPDEEDSWGQLVDHLLTKYVEPELVQPTFLMDYPIEISPLAKRHRSRRRADRALRGVRRRDRDRQRVHASSTTPTTSAPASSSSSASPPAATRRPSRSTSPISSRWSTECRRRAASASASTGS